MNLAFCHPFTGGLIPRIHVDIDEILREIVVDDSSFDDAGYGILRSGAVPKSTAGSTPLERDTVPSLDYGGQEEGGGIKTRGEHEEQIATATGFHIMPIGRKHRRLFLFRDPVEEGVKRHLQARGVSRGGAAENLGI